jgi:cytochrome P450
MLYRNFVQNLSVLLLGLPWILAPKRYTTAHQCRQRLVEVFHDYLNQGGAQHACSFIHELCQLSFRRGLSNENTARALVGSILAIVGNTIPTSFWLLSHIYSDPSLLAAVRVELEATLPCPPDDEASTVQIDPPLVRERCPLFISTYEEVLRMTAGISTVRFTTADTLVSNRWLLEKGSTVQMPTAFIHADPNTWGADADVFRSERFLNSKSLPKSEQSKRAAAYKPFGGGVTLCPGRHFAFHEVISFACSVLLGMEMTPIGGVWKLPKKDKSKMPLTSLKPVSDLQVEMSRRQGWENVQFS